MKVLKLKNPAKYKDFCLKRGLDCIHPVADGNGDLILPITVLGHYKFDDLADDIFNACDVIDYIAPKENAPDNPASIRIDVRTFKETPRKAGVGETIGRKFDNLITLIFGT